MGCLRDMMGVIWDEATWPGHLPLGVCPSSSPLSSHLRNLNGPPPPSISHLHPAAHTNWKLCGLCILMVPCREPFGHFSSSLFSLLLNPEMWVLSPHSLAHNSQSLTSRVHSLLRSETKLWCDFSLFAILLWGFSLPSSSFFRGLLPRRPPPSSCPDPGANQSEEQPGTRPGKETTHL
jgi:hypothetical protein